MNFFLFAAIVITIAVTVYLIFSKQEPSTTNSDPDISAFAAAVRTIISERDWDAASFGELRRDLLELRQSPFLIELREKDTQFAERLHRAISQGYTITVFQLPEDFTLAHWDALSTALKNDDEASFINLVLSAP